MRRIFPFLAAFLLLGLAYSAATPIFETPDELQHYAVVNYVARYGWFPPLGKPAEHYWDQQALQAPLFYWTAAAATFWVDTSDFSRQAVLQPKANIGDATLPGKKNAFLHGPDQAFPYRDTALAVHLCRWLSVLLGAGTLWLTYGLAQMACAVLQQGGYGMGAAENWRPRLPAAALAFVPQFIFIHASCSNDSAITFTATLTLFLLVRLFRLGGAPRRAALLGFAIGLMALSKLTGTALAIVAFGLLALTRRPAAFGAAAAVFGLTAGWWYLRNQMVYGDPLALSAFLSFVGGNLDVPPMSLSFLWDQFRLLRFSTWGLFGHISVLMQPEWIYLLFDGLAAAGLIGFGIAAGGGMAAAIKKAGGLDGLKAWVAENGALGVVAVWLAAVLAVGARWFAAAGLQGRLIFPGLPGGAVLWGLGLSLMADRAIGKTGASGRRSPQSWLAFGLITLMAAFAAAVVPAYLVPAYAPPPIVNAVPDRVVQTDIRFGDEIALRGYTIARTGDLLRLTFYWETLQPPPVDYTLAIRLVRADGSFWLDYVNYPGMGTSLPTTWRPGELRQDEYVFDVDRFPPEAAPMRLILGFFDPRRRSMLPVGGGGDSQRGEAGWTMLLETTLK